MYVLVSSLTSSCQPVSHRRHLFPLSTCSLVAFIDVPWETGLTFSWKQPGFSAPHHRFVFFNSRFPCPCGLATRHAVVSRRAASQSAVYQDTKRLRRCCLNCRLSGCSACKVAPQQRHKHNNNGSKQANDDNQQRHAKTTPTTTMSASNIASLSIDSSGIDEEDEATANNISLLQHRPATSRGSLNVRTAYPNIANVAQHRQFVD